MSARAEAQARYSKHRALTRELIEERTMQGLRKRVDVSDIDTDMLRRARRDWYGHPARRVEWDWEAGVIEPAWRQGCRGLNFALLVQGTLCGLVSVRLSPAKRWLSLTHLEGAPVDNPLKGHVLPIAVMGMYIYRSQIRESDVEHTGIRILNPLPAVVPYYKARGCTDFRHTKWLSQIVIEWPPGEHREDRTCEARDEAAAAIDSAVGA